MVKSIAFIYCIWYNIITVKDKRSQKKEVNKMKEVTILVMDENGNIKREHITVAAN